MTVFLQASTALNEFFSRLKIVERRDFDSQILDLTLGSVFIEYEYKVILITRLQDIESRLERSWLTDLGSQHFEEGAVCLPACLVNCLPVPAYIQTGSSASLRKNSRTQDMQINKFSQSLINNQTGRRAGRLTNRVVPLQ